LKKCLIVSYSLLALLFGFAPSHLAHAAAGASRAPSPLSLRKEISQRGSSAFAPLLQSWHIRFGTAAVTPLLQVASAQRPELKNMEDADRYIALMGAAKLGGFEAAPLLTRFLKDKSWMIRSGALRALSALKNPTTALAVLPLLQDPALVVRLEAVEAVLKLQPAGASEALLATLEHGANYHGGKAQWVPQKALLALASLHASGLAPRLKPLLDHEQDPDLQKQTLATVESLTGKHFKNNASLPERIRECKMALR
jgi:HEAT repeat protein